MSAGDSDPSTNSLLGRITRDLGIDQVTSDINLDDVAEVIPDIANPTRVTDSETNIVYNLVADLPVDSEEIREIQKEQQLQEEIRLIKEENDANAVKVEADGKFRIDALSLKYMSVTFGQLFPREVLIFRDDVPDNRFRAGEPAPHEPAGAQLGHRQGRQRQDRRAREDSRAAGRKQAQVQVGRSEAAFICICVTYVQFCWCR